MFDTVFGLPVHPLVVHATVVLVPVATILVAVCALWARARRVLVWPTVLVAAVAALTVAAASASGEDLRDRVPPSSLIRQHQEYADLLKVAVVLMCAAVLVLAYVSWRQLGAPVAGWLRIPDGLRRAVTPGWLAGLVRQRWVLAAAVVLSLVTAGGTLVATVMVGHSGAKAAWSKVAETPPRPEHRGDR